MVESQCEQSRHSTTNTSLANQQRSKLYSHLPRVVHNGGITSSCSSQPSSKPRRYLQCLMVEKSLLEPAANTLRAAVDSSSTLNIEDTPSKYIIDSLKLDPSGSSVAFLKPHASTLKSLPSLVCARSRGCQALFRDFKRGFEPGRCWRSPKPAGTLLAEALLRHLKCTTCQTSACIVSGSNGG